MWIHAFYKILILNKTTAAMRIVCRINVKRFKKRIVRMLRSNIKIFRVKKYHDIVDKDV